jgi:hypothetical protein
VTSPFESRGDLHSIRLVPRYSRSLAMWVISCPLYLDLGIRGVRFFRVSFRLDSAAEITHVPTSKLAGFIHGPTNGNTRRFHTAAGEGTAHLTNISFSLSSYRHLTFGTTDLLNPKVRHGLLALRDLARHFQLANPSRMPEIPDNPDPLLPILGGQLTFRLRPDHGGIPTPPADA